MLTFENAKISYIGETIKNKEDSKPTLMEGFGFYKNEDLNEFFLGNMKNDNFHKGLLKKKDQNYLIGEFSYKNEIGDKQEINDKTDFSGVLINITDENTINFFLGSYNSANSVFEGIAINNNIKEKEIKLEAGVFKEGKKNSKDFFTVILYLDEKSELISNFKIVYADYENDEPCSETYIEDQFSLLKIDSKTNKNISEFFYDEAFVYKGEFKFDDIKELNMIFDGKGIFLDLESGIKYSGNFKDGKMNGEGVLYLGLSNEKEEDKKNLSQKTFEGVFENDNFIKGVVKENGTIIIENAEFEENFELKKGKVVYDNKEFYNGEFKELKRNGKGIYKYQNNYEYDGEWKNGVREGNGTVYMEDNTKKVIGEWVADKLIKITESNIGNKQN